MTHTEDTDRSLRVPGTGVPNISPLGGGQRSEGVFYPHEGIYVQTYSMWRYTGERVTWTWEMPLTRCPDALIPPDELTRYFEVTNTLVFDRDSDSPSEELRFEDYRRELKNPLDVWLVLNNVLRSKGV